MLPLAILAGGLASRLGVLAQDKPKSLLPINGVPFLEWQLNLVHAAGYTDVVLCVSHFSDVIKEFAGNGKRFGLDISYSIDGDTRVGTGGAIKKALPLLGNKFGVLYGDSYLPINYSEVEQAFLNSNKLAQMTIFRNENEFDKSNVIVLDSGAVHYSKTNPTSNMNYIDYGLLHFQSKLFDLIDTDTEFDLSEICEKTSAMSQLYGFEVFQRFYEIGSISGIQALESHLKRNLY